MEMVAQVLVLLHLIGYAALFGGLVVQARQPDPEVNGAMLHGAWVSLLTGLGLVVLLVLRHQVVPYAPLSVKLVLSAFVMLLVAKNRKFQSVPRGLWALLLAGVLVVTGVSVLWR